MPPYILDTSIAPSHCPLDNSMLQILKRQIQKEQRFLSNKYMALHGDRLDGLSYLEMLNAKMVREMERCRRWKLSKLKIEISQTKEFTFNKMCEMDDLLHRGNRNFQKLEYIDTVLHIRTTIVYF